ncbi:hypothetical protein GCM10007067_15220 [Lysobacter bugurensis]|uniref:Uncharacterized protein n=2 Tax=Cognatilysobacter bugurensis TaxID=543356 RepID=A0A918W7U6_9GAMM|nr:hypothetical protein GCM10007067_15220 [Lysobacter bugurensis]
MGATKLSVGTIGAVAGGVIAQFTQGNAAQAWAGVSGVANGIQTQMDNMFKHAIDVKRKELVATAALSGAARIRAESSDERKVDRAMEMALGCSMNSIAADAQILELLSGKAVVSSSGPNISESFDGGSLQMIFPYSRAQPISQVTEQAQVRAKEVCETNGLRLQGLKPEGSPKYDCTGDQCKMTATFVCK